MNVIIPWSGGLDSTYLVYKALLEGHSVSTLSVEINNNVSQSKRESDARKAIQEQLGILFPNSSIRSNNLKFGCIGSSLSLPQAPLWVNILFYNDFLLDSDQIWIGYVMNDDAISYLDDIRNLYKSYDPFVYRNSNSKNLPSLEFPLTKLKKHEIISLLPPEILNLITVCESALDYECGPKKKDYPCQSCKRNYEAFSGSGFSYIRKGNPPHDEIKDITCEPISKQVLGKDLQLDIEFPEYSLS